MLVDKTLYLSSGVFTDEQAELASIITNKAFKENSSKVYGLVTKNGYKRWNTEKQTALCIRTHVGYLSCVTQMGYLRPESFTTDEKEVDSSKALSERIQFLEKQIKDKDQFIDENLKKYYKKD